MALDLHIDVVVVGLQLVGEGLQFGLVVAGQIRLVDLEPHRVVLQDHRIEELALGQLAGRLGAFQRLARGLVQPGQPVVVIGQARIVGLDFAVDLADLLVDVVLRRAAPQARRADQDRPDDPGG